MSYYTQVFFKSTLTYHMTGSELSEASGRWFYRIGVCSPFGKIMAAPLGGRRGGGHG